MAITAAVTNSFKKELLEAKHDFRNPGGHTFKLALYTSAATLNKSTTVYSSSNEVANSGSYAAGGGALTAVSPALDGDVAIIDYADLAFTAATITARGALIYNTSQANAAVQVLDFGADKTSTAGTFTITFPAPAAATAILQLA